MSGEGVSGDGDTETMTVTFTLPQVENGGESQFVEQQTVESVCTPILEFTPFFESKSQDFTPPPDESKKSVLLEEIRDLNKRYNQKIAEYASYLFEHGDDNQFLEEQLSYFTRQNEKINSWMKNAPKSAPSTKLRNYIIVEKIGQGASSEVYKVKHLYLKVFRAAKLFKRVMNDLTDQKAINEAQKSIRMSRHRNIVKIHDLDFVTTRISTQLSEKRCVIIMELVDKTLSNRIHELERKNEKMDIKEFFRIVWDILIGLEYIHDNNIVHFDIKPSNIGLVQPSEENPSCVRILDFGISSYLGAEKLRIGGSEGYIAPELYTNPARAGCQCDIFSLGQVMKKMLVNYRQDEIPERLINIINSCVEKDLFRRYSSAGDVIRSISHYFFKGGTVMDISNKRMHNWFYDTQFPYVSEKNFKGFRKELVVIEYDASQEMDKEVPSQYLEQYERLEHMYLEKVEKKMIWNNILFAIKDVFPFRVGEEEEIGVRIVITKTDYVHFRCMKDIFNSLSYPQQEVIMRSMSKSSRFRPNRENERNDNEISSSQHQHLKQKKKNREDDELNEQKIEEMEGEDDDDDNDHEQNEEETVVDTEIPDCKVFMNQSSVHCTIITEDLKMLFCRRSRRVDVSKSTLTCGAVESCGTHDLDSQNKPDYFHCGMRGLDEEIGFFMNEKEKRKAEQHLKLTGIMTKDSMETGFVGFLDLRGLGFQYNTSKDIHKCLDFSSAKDVWENEDWIWVDCHGIKSVLHFLKTHKKEMTQSGLCCAIFTLKSLYGSEIVERALVTDLAGVSKKNVTREFKL